MSTTAYSSHYRKELDVVLLLTLMAGEHPGNNLEAILLEIPENWRDWIRTDVICPSCGVGGAQVVSGTPSKKRAAPGRQAHFRFIGEKGGEAHHRFCEFNHDSPATHQSDSLVNLMSDRAHETRIVRELVCKAIEQKIFDQRDIRSMRQWFFDLKVANRFMLTTTEADINWLRDMRGHYRNVNAFHPCHAEMPDFDWNSASRERLSVKYADKIKQAWGVLHTTRIQNKALELVRKHRGEDMFDVSALETYYKTTIALCRFMASNYRALKYSDARISKLGHEDAPAALLALCAVLLFVSGWDFDAAAMKLARLTKGPPAKDQTLGNVMGLNPFNEYAAWRVVIQAAKFTGEQSGTLVYKTELARAEAEIRACYREWAATQQTLPPA